MSVRFIQPDSLTEAVAALAEYGDDARVIAGGTAVVLMLQQKLIAPEVLIDLSGVPDLDYVRTAADGPSTEVAVSGAELLRPRSKRADVTGLHLGPLILLCDVERSLVVREIHPALARACGMVGNVRVRNQATLGGNLAEADYASDPPAMLLALDAMVTATGTSGSRTIPLSEFFFSFYITALGPDEIITDIFVPAPSLTARMAYLKFRSRSSEDRPCVGVAAVAASEDGVCSDLRVAVGAACEVPQRLPAVEALAQGQVLTEELIVEIAEGYAAEIDTLDDLRASAWYRTEMIRVHVRRALHGLRVRGGHC